MDKILTIYNDEENKFLRKATRPFDFSKYDKKEIRELIKAMRLKMKEADGIGLSANQVGLDISVFVAQVERKFYAVFNPKIVKYSEEKIEVEEGCLSIPQKFGKVTRPEKVWLEGYDASNKKVKIKAWGLLARVFQHEVDHLNGKLFADHTKEIYDIPQQ